MLRVGLTGDLGSGKSTVAKLLAERGAVVLSSDEMARAMMQPGQVVYKAIVASFGSSVVTPDDSLDRAELARLAFSEGRAAELNAIVHPAVIAEQAREIEALTQTMPDAIVVVESALIFTTKHGPQGLPWRTRFDRIVLVTAPEEQKVARFLARMAAGRVLSTEEKTSREADARRRLALQAENEARAGECLVIANGDGLSTLEQRVNDVWLELQQQQANETR